MKNVNTMGSTRALVKPVWQLVFHPHITSHLTTAQSSVESPSSQSVGPLPRNATHQLSWFLFLDRQSVPPGLPVTNQDPVLGPLCHWPMRRMCRDQVGLSGCHELSFISTSIIIMGRVFSPLRFGLDIDGISRQPAATCSPATQHETLRDSTKKWYLAHRAAVVLIGQVSTLAL